MFLSILLVLLSLIWGSSFILIKKSLEHFNPYQVGALRVLISGVLLSPIALLNIKKFPKSHLKWLIIAALCGNFIPMFLFPIAETKVSSSIAGIINSTMPLFVILVGAAFWKTKTTPRQNLGIVISFFGVILLMNSGHDNNTEHLFNNDGGANYASVYATIGGSANTDVSNGGIIITGAATSVNQYVVVDILNIRNIS